MAKKETVRYQLKVILNHIKPQVWRRLVVPGSLTLRQLHTVFQAVFEWSDSHLHMFDIQENEYGDPITEQAGLRPMRNENVFRLEQVIPRKVGFRFQYTYDFGDDWQHVVLVEKILPAEDNNAPVCLAGKRAGPVEDSGGAPGYLQLIDMLQDPDNPENLEQLEWLGDDYDPEAFDLENINQRLKVLVDADYDLGSLFEEEDDEIVEDYEKQQLYLFDDWVEKLSPVLQQQCLQHPLRLDTNVLLAYLRDHRVTGTASIGNLPLKAVRAIVADFVNPPEMNNKLHPVRSEEDLDDLLFLHLAAFHSDLVDGGPGKRWVLTENGALFLQFPPSAQVLQLFLSWLFNMNWDLHMLAGEDQPTDNNTEKLQIVNMLASQPAQQWMPFLTLVEQVGKIAGWSLPNDSSDSVPLTTLALVAFSILILPLLRFEAIEMREPPNERQAGFSPQHNEVRFTPLGSSMLKVASQLVKL